jgi:WD40 repeat protein
MTDRAGARWNRRLILLAICLGLGALAVVLAPTILRRLFPESFRFWSRRGAVYSATIDATGRWIAVGGRDVGTADSTRHGDVHFCDARTGRVLQRLSFPEEIWGTAFNADGSLLAAYGPTAGNQSRLSVFAISAAGRLSKSGEITLAFLPRAAFCFGGACLVCAGDGQVGVWRAADLAAVKILSFSGKQVAVDPARGTVAMDQDSAAGTGVRCWDPSSSRESLLTQAEPPFAFLPRDLLVAKHRGGGSELAVWTVLSSSAGRVLPDSVGQWAGSVSSIDGHRLAAWALDGVVGVWDIEGESPALIARLSIPRVCEVRFDTNPDLLAAIVEKQVSIQQNDNGSSRVSGYLAGGCELWMVSQARCVHHFTEDDVTLHAGLIGTYLTGGERLSTWDLADPRQPTLLWEMRWRDASKSRLPMPE